jgi:hypothetical protein
VRRRAGLRRLSLEWIRIHNKVKFRDCKGLAKVGDFSDHCLQLRPTEKESPPLGPKVPWRFHVQVVEAEAILERNVARSATNRKHRQPR